MNVSYCLADVAPGVLASKLKEQISSIGRGCCLPDLHYSEHDSTNHFSSDSYSLTCWTQAEEKQAVRKGGQRRSNHHMAISGQSCLSLLLSFPSTPLSSPVHSVLLDSLAACTSFNGVHFAAVHEDREMCHLVVNLYLHVLCLIADVHAWLHANL